MRKEGNISFVVLVALLVVCCGAAIFSVASNSRYNAKTEYDRIKNRYIAESGVDTAVGLFIDYLENQDYVLAYTKNEGGTYSCITDFSPYILNEIKENPTSSDVEIDLVSTEAKAYLISSGFVDFKKGGDISLTVSTFGLNDKFKLTEMCTEPDFLITKDGDENKRSKLNPIFINVTATYNGGEVFATAKISDLYAVRKAFRDTKTGESESVTAWLDTANAKIEYTNYQNYGGSKK